MSRIGRRPIYFEAEITIRGERQALFRNCRPAYVAARPFELLAFTRPGHHAGVQRKFGYPTDPVIERLVTRRQRLQREDIAALLRPNGNAVRD